MEFRYKGRDERGELTSGTITARNRKEALAILTERGVADVYLVKSDSSFLRERPQERSKQQPVKSVLQRGSFLQKQKPQVEDLLIFSRQMHTLLKGGVPLLSALEGILPYLEKGILQEVVQELLTDLQAGHTLYQAALRQKDALPEIMIGLLRAGEETGNTEMVFEKLALHFEREKKTRDSIRKALRYPAIVMMVIIFAVVMMNIMVIPVFTGIFSSFGEELPIITVILIAGSDLMIHHWRSLLIAGVILYFVLTRLLHKPWGRLWWDKWKLKIPLVGKVIHKIVQARLCYSISMIFSAGFPIIQGLAIAGKSAGNAHVNSKVRQMVVHLEHGETVTGAARKADLLHPLAMQMLAAGEMAGSLDETLSRVSAYYDKEVDFAISSLSEQLEPVLTLAIGGLVLLLAVGIFIPLWDMTGLIAGG